MNKENIPTRRTLIIPKPLKNKFELYKEAPTPPIIRMEKVPALSKFYATNPLPYYLGRPEIEGGSNSFWSDFADGFKKGFTTTLDIGSHLLPLVGLGKKKKGGKKKVMESSSEESEREETHHEIEHLKHEEKENKKLNKIEKLAKEMKKSNKKMVRGEMVRDLMKNKGMKLGEASRYIKEHNLLK